MVAVKPDMVTGIANTVDDSGIGDIVAALTTGAEFQPAHVGADYPGYGRAFADGFDNVVTMVRQWGEASRVCGVTLRRCASQIQDVDLRTRDALDDCVTGW